MTKHRRTAAAVGLCLATATTSPGLAFQLHPARGIAISGRSTRGHDLGGRRSAACRHPAVRDDGHDDERRRSHALQESTEAPLPSSPRGLISREGRAGGGKDVAALVLSALLLGNPQLSDAATMTTPAAGAQGVDTATQNRLIADLEQKLTSLSASSGQQDQAPPSQASPTPASEQQAKANTESSRRSETATTTSAQSSTSTAQQASQQAAVAAGDAHTEAAAAGGGDYTIGTLGSVGGKPIVKLQEYTFSVKLPELNLPRVGPITVPEEGGLFAAPGSAGRVEAVPGLPGGGAVRDALVRAQKGEDVDGLLRSMAAMVPTQADYHR